MPYIERKLPKYPADSDVWRTLKSEERPIVVYGMGNGADKLIARFDKYGIEIADFFASDGFVRGHQFHGKRVKSFSEIKSEYSDFVIVLSFASNRDEVIEMLSKIDREYDMYAPDMPIASGEYFDAEFYNENYAEIVKAYNTLEDEKSRSVFSSVINYRLSGKISFLLDTYSEVSEKYELLKADKINTAIDAGAYNGDTAREMIKYFPNIEKVYAVEPDKRNYKKLEKFAEESEECEVIPINSAVYSKDGEGELLGSGNRNSTISGTASHKFNFDSVSLLKIDSIREAKIDYIKYDVEGSEFEALLGSHETIERSKPSMSVSLYHKSGDIFYLVNYLKEKYPDYKFYLRRTKCIPSWEIDLVMVY